MRALAERDRTVSRLIKDIISEEEAAHVLPPLRQEIADLQARLASVGEVPKIITLHPGAVTRYLTAVDQLAGAIDDLAAAGHEGPRQMLRELIASIVVHAPRAGRRLAIDINGCLAQLIDAPAFPHGSSVGGSMVAEEGFEPPTHGL